MLHKTIESVLQRGEKIDDLVQKSDGLSAQSKMFYRKSLMKSDPRGLVTLTIRRTSEEAKLMLVCFGPLLKITRAASCHSRGRLTYTTGFVKNTNTFVCSLVM